jgi:hypothetical protein
MMQFARAIQALCAADVEFVVIGGVSAALHGSAYVTKDLDICFSRTPENLRRLIRALAPYHPQLRDFPEGLPFLWEEATLRNGTIFTLDTDLGLIDLLAEVSGLGSFKEVEAVSVAAEVFGCRVKTLDLRSLIASKRAAGRTKDLMILPELEGLLEAQEP